MLLCFFNFNNYFYEVFTDKDCKIKCKKFGKSKEESPISDIEIINRVINKISAMKYALFETIEYNKEQLKLYFNSFNQKVYISKIENEKEVACDYYKYKEVYDMYNNPIIYNYKFLNNQEIFDNLNYSMANNNLFNNTNGNQGFFGGRDTQSPFNNQGNFGNTNNTQSPFNNQGDFGNTNNTQSPFNNYGFSAPTDSYKSTISKNEEKDENEDIIEKRRREIEKKRNRNKKIINVIIGGIVVSVVVISSAVLITRFKGRDIESETEDISIEEVIENTDDKVLQEILSSISDEEEWVQRQVIEQYQAENSGGLQQKTDLDEPELRTSEKLNVSKETQQIIDSINENPNLTEENKKIIIENYSHYFENNLKYFRDIEKLCDRLNTMSFIYDIKEETDLEKLGIAGEYHTDTNRITIYSNSEDVITHEVGHVIGDLGVMTNKLTEGYTELFNPKRNMNIYASEQTMILILEQIYGKDFMRSSYFNKSLFTDIFDTFNINKQDSNKHWELIKKCDSFLNKYEENSVYELCKNEEALKEITELLSELKEEYEEVTGKKWEENELLKLCYDRFTGEKTSDKHDGFTIEDIFINKDGEYSYRIGKQITRMVDVTDPKVDKNGEDMYVELISKTFNISNEFDIDER